MKRIQIAVCLAILAFAAGTAMYMRHTVLATGSHAAPVDNSMRLGPALGPPHLTMNRALAAAKQDWGPLLSGHPFTVEYGSFTDNSFYRRQGQTGVPVSKIDAWKFTVTGLRMARPCGIVGHCAPPVSTLTVIVDDKRGQYLEAQGG